MTHILFFTDTPLCGGAEQQMYLTAKFLDREKYRVSLACLSNAGLNPLCQKFLDEGFSVFRLPASYKNDPRIFFLVRNLLKREKIDIAHLHLWNPASARFALLACRAKNIPYIITEHDPFKLSSIKTFIKKYIMGRPHSVIAVSKDNENLLREIYNAKPKNYSQISNGIDVGFWLQQLEKMDPKKRTEAGPVFINVATLHERKGQHILIQAFANFLKNTKEYQNAKLILVGDGPARRSLEMNVENLGIKDSVEFLGSRRDIPQLLADADVYVQPSMREAFGLAILEAGICGLPVIASNVGGIPDIIEHENTGLLVPAGKPWELAHEMERLLKDSALAKRISQNLRERVIQEFDAKRMAQKTEKVYDNALL